MMLSSIMTSVWLLGVVSSLSLMMVVPHAAAQMTCNDYNNAKDLTLGKFTIFNAAMKYSTDYRGGLFPKQTNVHIYYIGANDQARWQGYPSNMIQPTLSSSTLQFAYNDFLDGSVNKGDATKAGVELWVPYTWLTNIRSDSIAGDSIEIQNTDLNGASPSKIFITDSGKGNKWYVNSWGCPIQYTASGYNSNIEAKIKTKSIFNFNADNGGGKINVIYGDDLGVTMTGDNLNVYIQGGYTKVTSVGNKNNVFINSNGGSQGCSDVQQSGSNNSCQTFTEGINGNGEITTPSCLSDTTAVSVGITVGATEGSSAPSSYYYSAVFLGLMSVVFGFITS